VKSYGQYCPILRGAEIFANRWTPVIVRNLLMGCETFGEIRAGAPGISRTLLAQRLRDLERAGVVERHVNGRASRYTLTDAGEELREVCWALGIWGARWLEVAPEHLDAGIVLWSMCRLIDVDQLPDRRVVVRFDLSDGPRRRFWIVAQKPKAEVCVRDPGFDDDLIVRASSESLANWHMGKVTLGTAMRAGLIQIEGRRALVRAFASWGGHSPFANVSPARSRSRSRSAA
jgi:DNA-binding HxlR family transcriptional regulator